MMTTIGSQISTMNIATMTNNFYLLLQAMTMMTTIDGPASTMNVATMTIIITTIKATMMKWATTMTLIHPGG